MIKIGNMDVTPLLDMVEPMTEVDLSVVIERPAPFFGAERVTSDLGGEKKTRKTQNYTQPLPLNRKSRNARTVDFFS